MWKFNAKLLVLLFFGPILSIPTAHTREKEPTPQASCRADARFEMEDSARRNQAPEFANNIASSAVPYRNFSDRFQLDEAFTNAAYPLQVNGKRVNAQKGKFGVTVGGQFLPQYVAYRLEVEREQNYLYVVDTSSVGILPGTGYRHYRWDDARADCLGMASDAERAFAIRTPGVDSLWDLPIRTNFGHIELLNGLQKFDNKFIERLVTVEHKGRDDASGMMKDQMVKDHVYALFVREARKGTRNGFVPDHAASKACYQNTMYAYLFSASHDIRYMIGLRNSDHKLGNQSALINTTVLDQAKSTIAQYIAKYSITQSDNVTNYYFDRTVCDCNNELHAQLKAAIDDEQKRQFRIVLNSAFSSYLEAHPKPNSQEATQGAVSASYAAVEEYIVNTGFDWTSVLASKKLGVVNHLALGDAMEQIRAALNKDHINKSVAEGGGLRVYCITENPKQP